MVLEHPKNNVSQILQEMETVRNLHGIGCGSTCGLCILAATIPAHYLNTRMLPEPVGESIRTPVRQDVY